MPSAAALAFKRIVTVEWPKAQEKGAKQFLVRTARDGHRKIMADARARGSEPEFEAYANRPGNTSLDSVVLPGPIVYRYRYMREVVGVALDILRKGSPVREGDYVRSHTIFINGTPVETLPARLKPTDEIFIANPMPYSRRLEVGRTKSGRSFVLQVPDRIYQRAMQRLRALYGKQAAISFGYVRIPNAYRVKGRLSATYMTSVKRKAYLGPTMTLRKRRQRVGEMVQSPAIFIELLT
jgi:hypothetical protein